MGCVCVHACVCVCMRTYIDSIVCTCYLHSCAIRAFGTNVEVHIYTDKQLHSPNPLIHPNFQKQIKTHVSSANHVNRPTPLLHHKMDISNCGRLERFTVHMYILYICTYCTYVHTAHMYILRICTYCTYQGFF